MTQKSSKLLGAVMLVSGTTIGAAMLAVPVSSGVAGFFPSLLLFFLCWAYLTYTAFLLLEVNLWLKGDKNIISMARHTIGIPGEALGWCAYLFLLYALTTAYLAASSPLFLHVLHWVTGTEFPYWVGCLPLIVVFGFFVYRGTRYVDLVNRLLMCGLTLAFLMLIGLALPAADTELLVRQDWSRSARAVSVIVTAFGYHIIIPSLSTYLHHDRKQLIQALLIGSLIPLCLYCVWEFVTMAVVPLDGEAGLYSAFKEGAAVTKPLRAILANPWLSSAAHLFEFCAIVTSFLGVSLSLTDFFADGFRVKKTAWGRALLCFMAFAPPYLITITNPRAFLSALEYAGAFGVVILLGLLPAIMVWFGRYRRGISSEQFRTPGGKPALLLIMGISICLITLEILNKIGLT